MSIILVGWRSIQTTPIDFSIAGDHHAYYLMALNHLDFHIAPFCWRVAVPAIASILPFSIPVNFYLITFASLFLTGIVLTHLLRVFGFSLEYALIGLVLFFSLDGAVREPLWDFWLTDPLLFLTLVAAIFAARSCRPALFCLTLALGVLAKEAVLFAAPLWYTLNARRPLCIRLGLQTVGLALPALAILAAVRLLIPAYNGDPAYLATLTGDWTHWTASTQYQFSDTLQHVLAARSGQSGAWLIYMATSGTFGPALLLALFSRKNLEILLRFSPFLLGVLAQLLFAVNNERLVVLAFPAVILMEVNGLAEIVTFARARYATFHSSTMV